MRSWAFAAVATLMTAAFVTTLQVSALSDFAVTLSATVFSSWPRCSHRLAAPSRRFAVRANGVEPGCWLSAGTGSWAAGQVVWSFYEVVLGQEVPFPSVADVGFLAFPLVGGVGLLIWSGAQGHQALARGRDLMDGAIIAVSLARAVLGDGDGSHRGGERRVRLLPGAVPGLPARGRGAGHPGVDHPVPVAVRADDAGAAGVRPRRVRPRRQRVRLPDQPRHLLVRRPGQQRWLGVRIPLRGRVRDERGPWGARVRGERPPVEGPLHVALAGAALPPPGGSRRCPVRGPAAVALVCAGRPRARRRPRLHGADPPVPGDDRQPAAADGPGRSRGPAGAPSHARRTHRSAEQDVVREAARSCPLRVLVQRRRPLLRPGQLQGRQRRARPRSRRPPAEDRRRPPPGMRARGRHRGSARRRRVRDPARGLPRCTGGGRPDRRLHGDQDRGPGPAGPHLDQRRRRTPRRWTGRPGATHRLDAPVVDAQPARRPDRLPPAKHARNDKPRQHS